MKDGALTPAQLLDELRVLRLQIEEKERQLVDATNFVQHFFSNPEMGAYLLDANDRFLQVSPTLASILGYSVEELVTLSLADVMHQDDHAVHAIILQRLLRGALQNYRYQSRLLCKDGNIFTSDHLVVKLGKNPDGRDVVLGLTGVVDQRDLALIAALEEENDEECSNAVCSVHMVKIKRHQLHSNVQVLLAELAMLKNETEFFRRGQDSPIPLQVLDVSAVTEFCNTLKQLGVTSFGTYFQNHRADLKRCIGLIRTIYSNHAYCALYRTEESADIVAKCMEFGSEQVWQIFARSVGAFAAGQLSFESESYDRNFAGELRHLLGCWVVMPGHEESRDRLLVTSLDLNLPRHPAETEQLVDKSLIQKNKLSSLGVIVAGVAHQINNPNNYIMMNCSLLQSLWEGIVPALEVYCEREESPNVGDYELDFIKERLPLLLTEAIAGSKRIKHIVDELRDFSSDRDGSGMVPLQINQVIHAAKTLAASRINAATSDFRMNLSAELPLVRGNFQRLEQVILNLLLNACEALTDKSQAIEVETSSNAYLHNVVIRITDRGCGIAEDIRDRITKPFFTTKRVGSGSGLGLSIAATIVEEHNGVIRFGSPLGGGASALIMFPALTETPRSREQP